jgi:hypothetical protein
MNGLLVNSNQAGNPHREAHAVKLLPFRDQRFRIQHSTLPGSTAFICLTLPVIAPARQSVYRLPRERKLEKKALKKKTALCQGRGLFRLLNLLFANL